MNGLLNAFLALEISLPYLIIALAYIALALKH